MVLIIVIGVIEALLIAGTLFFLQKQKGGSTDAIGATIAEELKTRQALAAQIEGIFGQMIGWDSLQDKAKELTTLKDALKLERGRVTITQAELETVETRLRELDEIDREIQASGLETKEELRILNKKEKDLKAKNDALKAQLQTALAQIEQLLSNVELNSQMQEQVSNMKTQIVQTEQKIDELLIQIELGNEQYFILKQTYDALDIEYAQLYEKFSEAEAMMASGQKSS